MFPQYYEEVTLTAIKREHFVLFSMNKVRKISKIKPNF